MDEWRNMQVSVSSIDNLFILKEIVLCSECMSEKPFAAAGYRG